MYNNCMIHTCWNVLAINVTNSLRLCSLSQALKYQPSGGPTPSRQEARAYNE